MITCVDCNAQSDLDWTEVCRTTFLACLGQINESVKAFYPQGRWSSLMLNLDLIWILRPFHLPIKVTSSVLGSSGQNSSDSDSHVDLQRSCNQNYGINEDQSFDFDVSPRCSTRICPKRTRAALTVFSPRWNNPKVQQSSLTSREWKLSWI